MQSSTSPPSPPSVVPLGRVLRRVTLFASNGLLMGWWVGGSAGATVSFVGGILATQEIAGSLLFATFCAIAFAMLGGLLCALAFAIIALYSLPVGDEWYIIDSACGGGTRGAFIGAASFAVAAALNICVWFAVARDSFPDVLFRGRAVGSSPPRLSEVAGEWFIMGGLAGFLCGAIVGAFMSAARHCRQARRTAADERLLERQQARDDDARRQAMQLRQENQPW